MKVLLIKTSSLGDVLHTLPALTDTFNARPDIRFDWVVEESLVDIPGWHPAVDRTIALANRRWRREPWAILGGGRRLWCELRERRYDMVLDAQGLIKSAVLSVIAHGSRYGLARDSAREPLAAWVYHHGIKVNRHQHAIDRLRQLFAAALRYPLPESDVDYGISHDRLGPASYPESANYVLFLHGTTWPSKNWPEPYWRELIRLANGDHLKVLLPAGNAIEKARAERLAADNALAQVLPAVDLTELASLLAAAAGVVAVDTGLGHLAAALAAPCVSIYGATDPRLTGTRARHQHHMIAEFPCAPCLRRRCTYSGEMAVTPACYNTVPPAKVWGTLQASLKKRK
jgi:heptosyltransferase-1